MSASSFPSAAWRSLSPWLADGGSLTRRLALAAGEPVRVRVLYQGLGTPSAQEARALGVSARARVWVREVVLYGAAGEWVRARSVMPLAARARVRAVLDRLGERPLARLLFRRRAARRAGPFLLPGGDGRWSLFVLQGQPLLVSEWFLPALPAYPRRGRQVGYPPCRRGVSAVPRWRKGFKK